MASKSESKEILIRQRDLSSAQNAIFEKLKTFGPLTRRKLVTELNLARTTVYDNLIKLQKLKLIKKYSQHDGKRGRDFVFWKIKEENL
ncbi:hypothetical protein LCGC14_2308010 [marine sediment metagenome]|uniref:Transcription regulator TrmB N-terminal domain-containing protein n=1 Tax=marine sediment metagenome TaxID=412755 RepID=A0A0F9FGC4_9ZZZZ